MRNIDKRNEEEDWLDVAKAMLFIAVVIFAMGVAGGIERGTIPF